MRKIIFLLFAAFLCFPIQEVCAWGQEGHRIVAQIAYNHLNKKAKKNIDKLLGEKGLIYWSNWADEIKSDTIYPNSSQWHFQDLNGGMSEEEVLGTLTHYPSEGGELWRAVDSLSAELRQNPQNFDALRFLSHLLGDCFCPMHTGHIDDLGGNRIKMKWFGQSTNLHRVWDSDLITARGYSYSEYADILEKHLEQDLPSIQQMAKEDFVIHNYLLTSEIYAYQTIWDENTYHYIYRFSAQMEWQLYAAGIYLARTLNEIYS